MTRAGWRLVALVVLLVLAGVGYVYGTDSDPGTAAAPGTSSSPAGTARPAPSRPAPPRPAPPRTAPSQRVPSPTVPTERDPESGLRWVELGTLPRQAQRTVALIEDGGPYPYAKDGATFVNRDQILPRQRSGFYREYTVPTPGEDGRGVRRIVTGDDDRQFFYTADHYDSFARIRR